MADDLGSNWWELDSEDEENNDFSEINTGRTDNLSTQNFILIIQKLLFYNLCLWLFNMHFLSRCFAVKYVRTGQLFNHKSHAATVFVTRNVRKMHFQLLKQNCKPVSCWQLFYLLSKSKYKCNWGCQYKKPLDKF